MPVSESHKLIFLERQFSDIKPLITVANRLLAGGHAESRFVKNAFRQCSSYWDQLHTVPKIKLPIHEIPAEEKAFLLKVLLLGMAYMVEVQRTSESAVRSLKVGKLDLMRLLGNLSNQVLAEVNFEPVPAFSQLTAPQKLKRASVREFRDSSLAFHQLSEQLAAKEIKFATPWGTAGSSSVCWTFCLSRYRACCRYEVGTKKLCQKGKNQPESQPCVASTSHNAFLAYHSTGAICPPGGTQYGFDK